MARDGDIFWRWLPDVRSTERGRALFFLSVSTLLTAGQTLGLASSEALFLARYGVEHLPQTFIVASLVTAAGMLAYGALVGSIRNDRIYVHMLWIAALVLVGSIFGIRAGVSLVLPALICIFFLTQAVFYNHFWTFASDYFDILASKRLVPLFAVGASVGGLVGGVLAFAIGRSAPPETLIAAWAVFLVATAFVIRSERRALRRWGTIYPEELDETSLEGMRAAARYLGRSPLGLWLAVSAGAMALALFVGQYLYSEIFVQSFPTAESLAVFFGIFLALSNLGEIGVEVVLTPWLVRRLGVTSANLVHPALTLLSFAALAVQPLLGVAVLTRLNREMLENALAGPVRNLTYNAMAQRFRGRMRAFVEGIVVYSGMALAGVALLSSRGVDFRWLCLAGGSMSLLYLLANVRIRREYLRTLVDGIREGRLDLSDVGDQLGRWEVARVASLWERVIADGGSDVARNALQLAPVLARRGITEPLQHGISHAHPDVRRACIEALSAAPGGAPESSLIRAVEDPDVGVRRAAVRALVGRLEAGRHAALLRARLADGDARVRVEAALTLGQEGHSSLEAVARAPEADAAVAALRRLSRELAKLAVERSRDPDPEVRATALEAVARLDAAARTERDALRGDLAHPDPRVRAAAAEVLAARREPDALAELAGALGDSNREVRRRAAAALRAAGDEGLRAAREQVSSHSEHAAREALEMVAALGGPGARAILVAELQRRVRQAGSDLVALSPLPESGDLSTRFLRIAHLDSAARHQRLALAILACIENPRLVESLARALRGGSPQARAEALEVLSHLGDRAAARLLVVLLDEGSLAEKRRALGRALRPPSSLEEVVDAGLGSADRWIRTAAEQHRKEEGGETSRRETMERLILLREVPLFARLSLEQLEAINGLLTESFYLEGEVVFREGDPAGELYLLVEGEAQIVTAHGTPDAVVLNTMRPPSYIGEMAILDNRPRSATVVISADARFLSLSGEGFKDLMLQMPEISFEICRTLTGRVRELDRIQAELRRARAET